MALLRHGRAGLINELGQHAAGDDALSTPLVWRFVEQLPEPSRLEALLRAPLPEAAVVLSEHRDGDTHVIDLELRSIWLASPIIFRTHRCCQVSCRSAGRSNWPRRDSARHGSAAPWTG